MLWIPHRARPARVGIGAERGSQNAIYVPLVNQDIIFKPIVQPRTTDSAESVLQGRMKLGLTRTDARLAPAIRGAFQEKVHAQPARYVSQVIMRVLLVLLQQQEYVQSVQLVHIPQLHRKPLLLTVSHVALPLGAGQDQHRALNASHVQWGHTSAQIAAPQLQGNAHFALLEPTLHPLIRHRALIAVTVITVLWVLQVAHSARIASQDIILPLIVPAPRIDNVQNVTQATTQLIRTMGVAQSVLTE